MIIVTNFPKSSLSQQRPSRARPAMSLKTIFTLSLTLLVAGSLLTVARAESLLHPKPKADALLPVDQAFDLQGATRKGHEIAIDWAIAPGYYLYGHTLKVSVDAPANAPFSGPVLPKGEMLKDAEFGDVEVYRNVMRATLTLPADAKAPSTLRVRYQGCADIGVCYPPQTRIVAVK